MRAYYCDHFVLPLPEGHRFPMDKYARLRAHVLEHGLVEPALLQEPHAIAWEDLRRVHTAFRPTLPAAPTMRSATAARAIASSMTWR